jgi:nucleoside 2-deoxyribosyltransferase
MKPTIYLAGAIRDGRMEDINWRERVIDELGGQANFLNPLGGKVYDPVTKNWTMSGFQAGAKVIVKHDLYCVSHSDIVIANLTSLSEGYPTIGTLMEFGAAVGQGKLIYSIIEPGYKGHENTALYKLHPFLSENSAMVFTSVEEAIRFLSRHLGVLSGTRPNFDGVLKEAA